MLIEPIIPQEAQHTRVLAPLLLLFTSEIEIYLREGPEKDTILMKERNSKKITKAYQPVGFKPTAFKPRGVGSTTV